MLRFRDGFGCVEGVMTDYRYERENIEIKESPRNGGERFYKNLFIIKHSKINENDDG